MSAFATVDNVMRFHGHLLADLDGAYSHFVRDIETFDDDEEIRNKIAKGYEIDMCDILSYEAITTQLRRIEKDITRDAVTHKEEPEYFQPWAVTNDNVMEALENLQQLADGGPAYIARTDVASQISELVYAITNVIGNRKNN